jgi:hypothetical protein
MNWRTSRSRDNRPNYPSVNAKNSELFKIEINSILDQLDNAEDIMEVAYELARHLRKSQKEAQEAGKELSEEEVITRDLLIKLRECNPALYDKKVKTKPKQSFQLQNS